MTRSLTSIIDSTTKPLPTIILFIIVGLSIYSNTLEAPFVLDDYKRIKENPNVRLTNLTFEGIKKAAISHEFSRNRPIGYVTFALNYYFHQYSLRGYHIVNIAIHVMNGFLIYVLAAITLNMVTHGMGGKTIGAGSRKEKHGTSLSPEPTTNSRTYDPACIAFLAALVWLVNPVHVQSVTYIVQRLNSLSAMFYLLALLFYIKGRLVQTKGLIGQQQGNRAKSQTLRPADRRQVEHRKTQQVSRYHYHFLAGSALCWMMALGCKQTAASLPLIVLLYEWYFFQGLRKGWLKAKLKYFWGLIVVFILVALIFMGPTPWEMITSWYARYEFTMWERVLTEFRVVMYYLSLLLFPHPSRLNLDYDFVVSRSLIEPLTTLFSFLAVGGIIWLAIHTARRNRLISFCILWFFANLAIESSIIPLALIFEHRTYLPSVSVISVAVVVLFRYARPRWLRPVSLCAVILLFSMWTYERNEVWSDEVALWEDCVNKSPNKARPRLLLGTMLSERGRLEEAITHYKKALKIDPDYAEAHNNLGQALAKEGRLQEAIRHYSEALRINPNYSHAYYNLGHALHQQGKLDEAIRHYSQALRIDPTYSKAHNNLGSALYMQGKLDEAIHHYSEALRISPGYEAARHNLRSAMARRGGMGE